MSLRTFALDEFPCLLDGVPVTEFASGDAIQVEFDDEDWAASQGSHGSVTRAKKHNRLVSGTLRIMQGSPTNELLMTKWRLDNSPGTLGKGAFSVFVKDNNGTTQFRALRAWIKSRPAFTAADEAGAIEWPLQLVIDEYNVGQNF